MSDEMVEIPMERARQFRDLLAAARHWRGGLIPRTSTGTWGPTKDLLEAIATFDQGPCDHPRSWRIYRDRAGEADEVCGHCGTTIVAGLSELPEPEPTSSGPEESTPTTSSPPESSSSSP